MCVCVATAVLIKFNQISMVDAAKDFMWNFPKNEHNSSKA